MMKSLLFCVLVASLSVATAAADSPTVSGNWKIHNNIAGNESDMACSFTQKDKDLSGSCQGDSGTVKISGKVDEKKVVWTYKSEYNGGPITLDFKGTLDAADKITGSVTVEEYGVDGDFSASLSQ